MNKDQFRQFVKSLILEVSKESKSDDDKKESKSKDYLDNTDEKYTSDVDGSYDKTSEKLCGQLDRIVKKINKAASCTLTVNNEIIASIPGEFTIRVKPVGPNLFNVEAYRNMSDLVYAIALDKEQVIDFVKVNFVTRKKSYVQGAFDKSRENLKDKTKKEKDLPKGEPVKPAEVSDKDKEDAVTDKNDDPSSPMTSVKEKDIERQEDHAVEKAKNMSKAVKMAHKEVDSDLTKSWKK